MIISYAGILIFALVKFYLRDLQIQNSFIRFAMGIYPNFLAGLIIPMLFIFKYDKVPVPKVNKFDIRIKCIMLASIIFLIFEEYKPTFLASRHFDYWDIVFSALGSALFYLVYRKLKKSKINGVEYD